MKSKASQTKTALAREALQAAIRLRTVGVRPTQQTAPVLMGVWQYAHDTVVKAGPTRCPLVLQHMGLKCLLDVVWTGAGNLQRFTLRDSRTGALLLAGDGGGPVFPQRGRKQPGQDQELSTLNAGNQPA